MNKVAMYKDLIYKEAAINPRLIEAGIGATVGGGIGMLGGAAKNKMSQNPKENKAGNIIKGGLLGAAAGGIAAPVMSQLKVDRIGNLKNRAQAADKVFGGFRTKPGIANTAAKATVPPQTKVNPTPQPQQQPLSPKQSPVTNQSKPPIRKGFVQRPSSAEEREYVNRLYRDSPISGRAYRDNDTISANFKRNGKPVATEDVRQRMMNRQNRTNPLTNNRGPVDRRRVQTLDHLRLNRMFADDRAFDHPNQLRALGTKEYKNILSKEWTKGGLEKHYNKQVNKLSGKSSPEAAQRREQMDKAWNKLQDTYWFSKLAMIAQHRLDEAMEKKGM